MSSDVIKSDDVVFLLGAGASVNAGVPDTFGMVTEFAKSIEADSVQNDMLGRILAVLRSYVKRNDLKPIDKVDVEFLLESLDKLENKENDVILDFFESKKYILSNSNVGSLTAQLKDFIRKVAVVPEGKITYFEPLLSFINTHYPVNIFSLNYDTCIEQFCNVYKKDYVDGFDVNWNPKLFDEARNADIRLYKLHGSVMWYRTNKGNYVKLLASVKENKIKLLTGEEAESLILYPMRKLDYYEPLIELLLMLKRKLEKAKVAIVVGYSFRDSHIRQILWDAANRNKELVVFLISPNATRIYDERLRYYNPQHAERIPTPLEGKVIPLSYRFEKVFPLLPNSYLQRLQGALAYEKGADNSFHGGNPVSWHDLISVLVDCEYLSKADFVIRNRADWGKIITMQWPLAFQSSFKALLSAIASGEMENIKTWSEYFSKTCEAFSVERLDIILKKSPGAIQLTFDKPSGSSDASSYSNSLRGLQTFLEQKRVIINDDKIEELDKIKTKIEKVTEYLDEFANDEMNYERYRTLRNKDYSKVRNVKRKADDVERGRLDDNKFENWILEIEKVEFEKILGGKRLVLGL